MTMRLTKSNLVATAEIVWRRLRNATVSVLGIVGLGTVIFGGYVMARPDETVAPYTSLVESLPAISIVTPVDGLFFVLGGVFLVWLAANL